MSDDFEDPDDVPPYRERADIGMNELVSAIDSLQLMDDPYLSMQTYNLALVDQFIMELEEDILQKLLQEERAPPETMFLSAQSQMWIFAAYELMRTWRESVPDVLKLHKNGGLKLKIDALRRPQGFVHVGRELRAGQLRRIADDKSTIERIREDLRLALHSAISNTFELLWPNIRYPERRSRSPMH